MRNLFFLLTLTLIFVLTGCGSNPEKILPSEGGKWNFIVKDIDGKVVNTGTIEFPESGKVNVKIIQSGVTLAEFSWVSWSYKKSSKRLTYKGDGVNTNDMFYTVLEKEESFMKYVGAEGSDEAEYWELSK